MCGCKGRVAGLKLAKRAVAADGRENEESPVAYRTPLRQALIDDNAGHVNVVVCEADYRALKRGIGHLAPPPQ